MFRSRTVIPFKTLKETGKLQQISTSRLVKRNKLLVKKHASLCCHCLQFWKKC